jgi:sugar lactone lactonase YvrE
VDKVGHVFVSIGGAFGPRGAIWEFTPSGEGSVLCDFGTPGAAGLAVDAVGNVYVARTIAPNNGVYLVDRHGQAVRLPGTEQIVFPNALAFDPEGNLYITETFSIDATSGSFGPGGIWRIARGGTAQPWLRDELLTGLAPSLFPYPVGANGLACFRGALYAVNSDKALVVRIPIHPDNTPGQPEVWTRVEDVPESLLFQNPYLPLMIDGIALDVHGNAYLAVPSRAAVVRIHAFDRSQDTIAVYPVQSILDSPLSLAFGTGAGARQSLFITNGGLSALFVPELPWAGPGLVRIDVGVPGLPLP